MSERKVLNKYFPPDFDPSKVPRMRKSKDRQEQIRLMAPFSMRCNSCGEYIYAGKKFNGRKETVQGESYYGIKIFRFYIKCPVCSSEITFKTDPKNADYTVEHGVSRNFEPWREEKSQGDDDANGDSTADPLAHLIAEEGLEESDDEDPMKTLERRQEEAKREMEIMDALQDIRARNARIDRVDADTVLERRAGKGKDKLTEQQRKDDEADEALVQRYFGKDLAAQKADKEQVSNVFSTHVEADRQNTKSVKRARPTDLDVSEAHDEVDRDPDVLSILSEKAREQLLPVNTLNVSSKVGSLATKRKKGTSAFGIVRKKS